MPCAEQLGPRLVAVLDLEQREERRVAGHEPHRRLGALADAHERVGVGVHRLGLRAAQPQPHAAHQLGEQGFLVLEVPVEEALGDAGGLADVDDAGVGVAALGEQDRGLVEQLLLALAALVGEPPAVGPTRVHTGAVNQHP